MTKDFTGFERADRFAQGLGELHDEGRNWSSLPDIALRACILDESYMRWRRLANRGLRLVGVNRGDVPSKAPYLMYGGAEASAAIAILEKAGLVESTQDSPVAVSLDLGEGDTVYRLVSEDTATPESSEVVFRPTRRLLDSSGPYVM
jgi:hypothetical protein